MSDLHGTRDPERGPEIDTAGWLFSAVAVAIIAAATMAAYKAQTRRLLMSLCRKWSALGS